MKADVAEELARRDLLSYRWDVGLVLLWTLGSGLIFFAWFQFYPWGCLDLSGLFVESTPPWVGSSLSGAFHVTVPVVLTKLLLLLLSGLDAEVRKRWLRTYLVVEEPGVVKVYGSIPFVHLDLVRNQLLAGRAGYRLLGLQESFRDHGCTLAAVKEG